MKNQLNFYILFILIEINSAGWSLFWSDEFSDPTINTLKWGYNTGCGWEGGQQ